MTSARARFKYALRQCRLDELTISSTKLADSMDNHDVDSFWKDIMERNKSKSTISHWRIEGGAKGALPPPPLKLVKV